jgi:hypothetical protein
MNAVRHSSVWMSIAVFAAGVHGLYDAVFTAGSIESQSLRIAVSLGLLAASLDPVRYWPAVLAGLAARVAPQVGLAIAGRSHPVSLIFADAIWWAPLSFILFAAYSARVSRMRECSPDVLNLAMRARTEPLNGQGVTLGSLSCSSPVLLIFLRHAGCPFSREALADIAVRRPEIEGAQTTIVLAHMGGPEEGLAVLRKYGLDDLHQISDPCRSLYRAFGLRRGGLWKLFGPKVWLRSLDACILHRHGLGRVAGDALQMPGMFLIFHGQVLRSYRHQCIADRPDYVRFTTEDSAL